MQTDTLVLLQETDHIDLIVFQGVTKSRCGGEVLEN